MIIPFGWRDGIEILFFSGIFYYLALWLRQDRKSNLLWYFYGYCIAICTAYFAALSSVSLFLLLCSPIIIMLFMVIHQETLQRNFVALKNTPPIQPIHTNWLEIFMQGCLIAMNKNKTITCIIERTDSMQELVQAECTLNTPLNTLLMETILTSTTYSQDTMLWINDYGMLRGINTKWHTWPEHANWLDCACIYTAKTDVLILHCNPSTRSFTLVVDGNPIDNVNTQQIQHLLQKYVYIKIKKGNKYGITPQNNIQQERTT